MGLEASAADAERTERFNRCANVLWVYWTELMPGGRQNVYEVPAHEKLRELRCDLDALERGLPTPRHDCRTCEQCAAGLCPTCPDHAPRQLTQVDDLFFGEEPDDAAC